MLRTDAIAAQAYRVYARKADLQQKMSEMQQRASDVGGEVRLSALQKTFNLRLTFRKTAAVVFFRAPTDELAQGWLQPAADPVEPGDGGGGAGDEESVPKRGANGQSAPVAAGGAPGDALPLVQAAPSSCCAYTLNQLDIHLDLRPQQQQDAEVSPSVPSHVRLLSTGAVS